MSYPWYAFRLWFSDNSVANIHATGITVTDAMLALLRDIATGKWVKETGERLAPVTLIVYQQCDTKGVDPVPGYEPSGKKERIKLVYTPEVTA